MTKQAGEEGSAAGHASDDRGVVLLDEAPRAGRLSRRSGVLIVILAALVVVGACGGILLKSSGRKAVRTALLLPEIMVELPLRPSALFAPAVKSERVSYEVDGVAGDATIWRPVDGRHSALILSLGVNPAPPDDPRVVRLMRGLARGGLVVMLLQSAELDADRIEPPEIDRIIAGFKWLERQPFATGEIGLTGFSVGASLLLIAAADPEIRQRVAVVNAFGGYADLKRLAIDAVTRSYFEDGRIVPWEPDELTVRLIRKHLAESLQDTGDRELLLAALPGDLPSPPEMPDFRTEEARRTWAFLTAGDRDAALDALNRLSPPTLDRLGFLSPDTHLAGLRSELFVMHDRNDAYIPVVEARALSQAARGITRVHLTEFDLFEHVDLSGGNPYLVARESLKLFWHIFRVLDRLE